MLILSHFGVITEETGPGGKDELPTPLRYMEFLDDIWYPFVHFAGALIICYGGLALSRGCVRMRRKASAPILPLPMCSWRSTRPPSGTLESFT